MFDSLYTPEFWLIVVLLLSVLWIINSNTRKYAYKLGATHGFALGINHTVGAMLDEHIVDKTNDRGYRVNKAELVEYITPIITAKLQKQLRREV